MAIIKMQMPDDSPQGRRRLIASTGAYGANIGSNEKSKFAKSGTANLPITRNAQFAGSGANVAFTQPMFFSPMHTPQNWQIASKRREIYQWCFTPQTLITMSDGSQREIENIYPGDEVLSHLGKPRKVTKVFKRKVNEDISRMSFSGLTRSLNCTFGHKIRSYAKKPAYVSCSASLHKMQDNSEDFFSHSSYVQAKDIEKGNVVFSPKLDRELNDIFDSEQEAFLFGLYLAEGSVCWYKYKETKRPKGIRLCIDSEETALMENLKECCYFLQLKMNVYENRPKGNRSLDIHIYDTALSSKFVALGGHGARTKKLDIKVVNEKDNILNYILSGFVSGDGHVVKRTNNIDITTSSRDLAYQISLIANTLNIPNNVYEFPIKNYDHFHYKVILSSENVNFNTIKRLYTNKSLSNKKLKTSIVGDISVSRKVKSNDITHYNGYVYDLEVEEEHSYIAEGIAVSNSRFYYENEPKVAAGIDFYAHFPLNGFKLECKDKKILQYYESLSENIELGEWLDYISHEYFLLGDVFPFLEIDCPVCSGSGVDPESNERCNHPNGSFKSIKVMNPDYIEVQDNVLANEPFIALMPDEELQMIVQRRQPKHIYDNLPDKLIELVASGRPIPLSNRSVSHLKHNASGYATYGTSLLRRLFTVLAYKTKIMTANWIIAERLILPIRVVKVGEKDRPATEDDIQDVVNQLAAVANDPNLSIVTHHAFCYDEETEVLTDEGWKFYDELNHDEKIMVFDPNTGQSFYEDPISYKEFDVEGPMVRVKSNKANMLVTPNHRMLVYNRNKTKWTVETADEFTQRNECDRYVRSVAEYESETNLDSIEISGHQIPIDDFLEFAGWYLAEGYTVYNEEKRQYRVSWSQCPTANQTNCEAIQSNVDKLGLKTSVYAYDGKTTSWNILSKDVAAQMKIWFGSNSHTKRIPSFIKNLRPDQLQKLIRSYLDGDATSQQYSIGEYVQCGTVSEQLADDLMEILFKAGYAPTKSRNKKEDKQWVVNCSLSNKAKGRFSRIKDSHISHEHYKGKVWCFKTSTGFFVTRRHGRIAIQGNTYDWYGAEGKIHNISTELELIGKEILDGLMLNQALLNGEMGGYCFDDDTLTLTDSGFKPYYEITPEDKIACYNPETKTLEYHAYYKKHVFDYDNEMVKFSTDKIDILVTPNHRMWSAKRDSSKFEFTEAKDIKRRARFIGTVDDFDGNSIEQIQIVETSIPIYEYCELAGFYVSEGSTSKNLTVKGDRHSVHIGQSQIGKASDEIKSCLDRIPIKHYRKEGDFTFYNPDLAIHFHNEYGRGSVNKKLPSWLKNLCPEYLEVLLRSMILGDGSTQHEDDRNVGRDAYHTSSKQLAMDVAEIAFKCGYATKISHRDRRGENFTRKNKKGVIFKTKTISYTVHLSKGFKGKTPVLDSKSKKHKGKEIERVPYSGKVYCFTVPHGLFATMRNGKITVQGNSSAQVGVEIMIRRLDNWRNKLKAWVEKKIFLPIAMMQGFVDEEKSKRTGETEYLYPKIKWKELELRDKTNKLQLFMQMFDKQMVSMQTVLEEAGLDYDAEVEKMREEKVIAMEGGQIMDPNMAGGMGGPMGGGDMGGMPPGGDMGGMPPGGYMGGMPPGGDMGGGMPGMGGMPPGGQPAAASSNQKVMKKGKAKKDDKQEEAPQMMPIKLTKLEGKMYKALQSLRMPYTLFGQYAVNLPGQPQPFVLDFAYPELGVGIETDGQIWHERPDLQARDRQRDQKLANVGWRILRFNEDAVEDKMDLVKDVIKQNMVDAYKAKKKKKTAGSDGGLLKLSDITDKLRDPKLADDLLVKVEDIPGVDPNIAYMILLGT